MNTKTPLTGRGAVNPRKHDTVCPCAPVVLSGIED